jgi:ribosomal protein S18 acetylase RimI-like enzyme
MSTVDKPGRRPAAPPLPPKAAAAPDTQVLVQVETAGPLLPAADSTPAEPGTDGVEIRVRRLHRRDLNHAWEFLKLVFRDVNRETVEYQRPRTKRHFMKVYEEELVEQILFEVGDDIVGYAECAFEATGEDNWINVRYFEKRGMRPLFVEELAVHPDYQGRGVGGFMMDQLQHLARLRGCTHLVLEVAENNKQALAWYRKRNFYRLDAAIFMAQKVSAEPDLLPPRKLATRRSRAEASATPAAGSPPAAEPRKRNRQGARTPKKDSPGAG